VKSYKTIPRARVLKFKWVQTGVACAANDL